MCGICGVVTTGGLPVRDVVEAMMNAMAHRGPDDSGAEVFPVAGGGRAAVGFRRLAILDLSPAGHQPMIHPDTGDTLVFNGEIYNHRELRGELEAKGVRFRGTSDTEVLLHALAEFGEAALARVQGMYALAFRRATNGSLLLARDPLGIKPLYVATRPDCLLFASEMRALIASGEVSVDVDTGGVAGMLAYGAVQSPRTVFSAIRAFPAGHCRWIDGSAIGSDAPPPRRFWSFPERTSAAVSGAPAEVRSLLERAVASHLQADVPLGVFLSAGIDSTVIATLAARASSNVTAFTVGFDAGLGEDEIGIAGQTARSLGLRHVPLVLDVSTMPRRWRSWMETMDSPSIDGFNTWVVSDALAREGVVVGLSGLGADELFGGYPTFWRSPRLARSLRRRPVRAALRMARACGFDRWMGRQSSFDKVADIADGSLSDVSVILGYRRVLSDRWLRAFGLERQSLGLDGDWLDGSGGNPAPVFDGDPFNTIARSEAVHYMGDTLLRDTDANSMRHSLEVRVPFLDLPLVDYVSGLPGSLKGGGPPGKRLLRDACGDLVPSNVIQRKKTGFTLPIGEWMRGAMREFCDASIEMLARRSEVRGDAVRRFWAGFLARPEGMHWSRPLALVVLGNYLGSMTPPVPRRNG